MADLPASFAKLLVADADASIRLYEALGFVVVHRDAVFTRLRWVDGADLYLVRTPAGHRLEGRRGVGVLLCFTMASRDDRVDDVADRARAAGATVDGPADQMWHTREVVVTDPDGYRLNFVQSSWEGVD